MDVVAQGCEVCVKRGRPADDAPHRYVLTIDGGPEKNVDMCDAHNDFFELFLAAYHQAVALQPQLVVERISIPGQVQEAEVWADAEQPARQLELEAPSQAIPAQAKTSQDKGPEFICQECDTPKAIKRSGLSSHAKQHGKGYREIKWSGWGKLPVKMAGGTKKKPKKGEESILHVVCPLPHRSGAEQYWVPFDNRGGHASGAHKVKAPEVEWGNPDGIDFSDAFRCVKHKVCVAYDGGQGYPFLKEESRDSHYNKTPHWELAPEPLRLASAS